ncbi:Protein phosphatase 2C 2 [Coemansia sp. RSA 485]|nr:Protein phosphatase 2C 2 [Coemansia sp. RSA 485]
MGQTLSEPVVDKHSSLGGDKRYLYGASAMQGWRIYMHLPVLCSSTYIALCPACPCPILLYR